MSCPVFDRPTGMYYRSKRAFMRRLQKEKGYTFKQARYFLERLQKRRLVINVSLEVWCNAPAYKRYFEIR